MLGMLKSHRGSHKLAGQNETFDQVPLRRLNFNSVTGKSPLGRVSLGLLQRGVF